MTFAETFFSFFNGMVAGKFVINLQVGLKLLLCNLLKSLKSDFKLNRQQIQCTMVLQIVLKKLSKMKDFLHFTKVRNLLILGSVTPLIGVGILGSMRFGLYENFKKILSQT